MIGGRMFGPGSTRDRGVVNLTATIANGASLSGAVDLKGYGLLAIQMPAAWTAADLTFQASADGGTAFADVYDDNGAEVQKPAAANRYILVNQPLPYGVDRIKIRSGTSGTPVNQGAARTLTLLLRVL